MQIDWDVSLVILSVLIAVFGSFTALTHAQRMQESNDRAGKYWLWAGGVTLGIAIWAMHFVGMLAMQLPVRPSYDLSLTLVSVLPAIVSAIIGFYLVQNDEIRPISIIKGGFAMGVGISVMHYIGMLAFKISPTTSFSPFSIALSILTAIIASIGVLLILKIRKRTIADSISYQMGSAIIMGSAIAGMHYASMIDLSIAEDSIGVDGYVQIPLSALASIVVASAIFLFSCGLAAGVFDRRMAAKSFAVEKTFRDLNDNLTQLVAEQTQELHLSEERFRDLIAAVPGAVYEFVIDASGKRSLTYISCSSSDLI